MPKNNQGLYLFQSTDQFLWELESYLKEAEKYLSASQSVSIPTINCNFTAMFDCVSRARQTVSSLREQLPNLTDHEENACLSNALAKLMNGEYGEYREYD
ncbi:MAG: hypothetical protein KME06_17955 [Kastovskya adunca ATA6-11-RM4]|jgi:hypothetical protein|nr:hypothetical protein [Kastovskya adunca ATA6-11-RM4]